MGEIYAPSCTVAVPVNVESKEQLYVGLCEMTDKYAADNANIPSKNVFEINGLE